MSERANISEDLQAELFRLAYFLDFDLTHADDMKDSYCVELIRAAISALEKGQGSNEYDDDRPTTSQTKKRDKYDAKEKKLASKAKGLKDELKSSVHSIENVDHIKQRNMKLTETLRREREQKIVLDQFIESQNKKIEILADHIEKLMKAIKIESSNRMKSLECNREQRKELADLKLRLEKKQKVITRQNRYAF